MAFASHCLLFLRSVMKLHQLKIFSAIAETGSVRAAARHLSISPSAITKSTRELEAGLRAPLLNRGTSGVALTEYGQVFLVHARLVLKQLERAQAEIDAMHGAAEQAAAGAGRMDYIRGEPWVTRDVVHCPARLSWRT